MWIYIVTWTLLTTVPSCYHEFSPMNDYGMMYYHPSMNEDYDEEDSETETEYLEKEFLNKEDALEFIKDGKKLSEDFYKLKDFKIDSIFVEKWYEQRI